jgi:hypothetical protein
MQEQVRTNLQKAKQLIDETGYSRRKPEVEELCEV